MPKNCRIVYFMCRAMQENWVNSERRKIKAKKRAHTLHTHTHYIRWQIKANDYKSLSITCICFGKIECLANAEIPLVMIVVVVHSQFLLPKHQHSPVRTGLYWSITSEKKKSNAKQTSKTLLHTWLCGVLLLPLTMVSICLPMEFASETDGLSIGRCV